MKLRTWFRLLWFRCMGTLAAAPVAPVNREIEAAEAKLITMPQLTCPLRHLFAPGIYLREITMPKGALIIGHEHRTRHFNVILSGRARVSIQGETQELVAPTIFVSEPGVRKVLYILETMRWATIHATDETDVPALEKLLVRPSAAWLDHQAAQQLLGDPSNSQPQLANPTQS